MLIGQLTSFLLVVGLASVIKEASCSYRNHVDNLKRSLHPFKFSKGTRHIPRAEEILQAFEEGHPLRRAKRNTASVPKLTNPIGYKTKLFQESLPARPRPGSRRTDKVACFNFDVSSIPKHTLVHYAVLTVFKKCKKTSNLSHIDVSLVHDDEDQTPISDKVISMSCTPGFQRFDLSSLVFAWARNPRKNNRGICIVRRHVTVRNRKRILVVSSLQGQNLRYGRGRNASLAVILEAHGVQGKPTCSFHGRTQTCCRKRQTISFDELGLGDVILLPRFYNSFTCSGFCLPRNISGVAREDVETAFRHVQENVINPCQGTSFASLHVLVFDPVRKLRFLSIPRAIVLGCGCGR